MATEVSATTGAQLMFSDDVPVPEAICRVLEEAGIEYVFGLPGGNTGGIYNALYDHRDTVRGVLVREEGIGAIMAEVYGRLTGRPAGSFLLRLHSEVNGGDPDGRDREVDDDPRHVHEGCHEGAGREGRVEAQRPKHQRQQRAHQRVADADAACAAERQAELGEHRIGQRTVGKSGVSVCIEQ